jgi:uncharacterized Zn finger protein (UPF0148 family)
MHSATCPSCGMHVEFDFLPVAGMVWCPKCQKLFSPPAPLACDSQKPDHRDADNGSPTTSTC